MALASVAIRTQAEVAIIMGVTRSYVMQVEHSALRKLRKGLTSK